ncbi:MAG: M56 family metallopeptidase [Armatimonadetes bacterium]|nr:M56 family metallopeptidase [Armatimonadota bacterium]
MNALWQMIVTTTPICAATLAAVFLARKQSASVRHVIVTAGIFALLATLFVPSLAVPVPNQPADQSAAKVAFWDSRHVPLGLSQLEKTSQVANLYVPSVVDLGTGLLFLRLCLGLFLTYLIWRRANPDSETPIRYSDRVNVAVTLPWGIVVPSCGASHEVLIHERAHQTRLDPITQIASQVVLALFWVQPLLWYLVSLQRKLAESAADDAVLQHGANGQDYAQTMLDMAKSARRTAPAVGMPFVSRSALKGRVASILDARRKRNAASSGFVGTMILVGLGIALAANARLIQAPESEDKFWTGLAPKDGRKETGFKAIADNTRLVQLERLVFVDKGGIATNWSPDGTPLKDEPQAPYRHLKWNIDPFPNVLLIFKLRANSRNGEVLGATGSPTRNRNFFSGTTTFAGGATISRGDETTVVSLMSWKGAGEKSTFSLTFADEPWSSLVLANHRATLPTGSTTTAILVSLQGSKTSQGSEARVKSYVSATYQTRGIFVDSAGKEHEADFASTEAIKGGYEYLLKCKVPIADVRQFRFEARPSHSVEFVDVAIKPNGEIGSSP